MAYVITNSTTHFKLNHAVDFEHAIQTSGGLIKHTNKVLEGKISHGFDSIKFRVPLSSLNKATGILYRSGKVLLVGAKTWDDILESCLNITIWFGCGLSDCRISNLCAKMDMQKYINLYKLGEFILKNPEPNTTMVYEPELFPALNYKYNGFSTNCHCVIYSSGKVLITGVKNIGQLEFTSQKIECLFMNFWKNESKYIKNKS